MFVCSAVRLFCARHPLMSELISVKAFNLYCWRVLYIDVHVELYLLLQLCYAIEINDFEIARRIALEDPSLAVYPFIILVYPRFLHCYVVSSRRLKANAKIFWSSPPKLFNNIENMRVKRFSKARYIVNKRKSLRGTCILSQFISTQKTGRKHIIITSHNNSKFWAQRRLIIM